MDAHFTPKTDAELAGASADNLEQYLHDLTNFRGEILAEGVRARDYLDEALAKEEAEAKVAGLTDMEKAALAQVIRAEGIPSDAEVGTPGQ